MAIAGISNRFNQPGYIIYNSLESLLVSASNNEPFNKQLTEVVAFYEDDFDSLQLSAQSQNLASGNTEKVSLKDCLKALQKFSFSLERVFQ